ncbi:MAG: NUDIX domain-containing protein, partial [Thermoleophilia bacterium]
DAARRELGEELGLDGVEPEPLGRTLLRGARETELCAVFLLRHDGPFRVALPEVAGLAVFPPGELPAPLTPAAGHVLAWLAARRAADGPPE